MQKQQFQVDMKNFKKSQEIWKAKQQIEIEDENKRIFEFLEQKEKKLKDEELKKQEAAKTKSELSSKMVQELFKRSVIFFLNKFYLQFSQFISKCVCKS